MYVTVGQMWVKSAQSPGPEWSRGNPCGCVDVQVQLAPQLRHAPVTKLPGWRTLIWTSHTGDGRQVKLDWLTREWSAPSGQSAAHPFTERDVPEATCPLWATHITNEPSRRKRWSITCPWSSEWHYSRKYLSLSFTLRKDSDLDFPC